LEQGGALIHAAQHVRVGRLAGKTTWDSENTDKAHSLKLVRLINRSPKEFQEGRKFLKVQHSRGAKGVTVLLRE